MNNIEIFLRSGGFVYKKDSSIKDFLTIKIGGKVKFIVLVNSYKKLLELIIKLHHEGINFIILGGGSNTIFPDKDLNIVTIINQTSDILKMGNRIIKVNGGILNNVFLKYCKKEGIAGFEFLSGIPGTLGGAVAVNAGAFGHSISDYIVNGEIFTEKGEIKILKKNYFEFSYRNSKFKFGKDVILNVFLKYNLGDSTEIDKKIKEIFSLRTSKHPPYSDYSSGCFFKNPVVNGKKISAGKLIEDADFKGYSEKNIKISEIHSNFLINRGNSSFSEIKKIENKIKRCVKDKSGILLDREVIYISPEGEKY